MEVEAARYIAKAMIIMTMIATAIGEGYLVGKTMEAIGRNPEVGDSLFTKMIIGLALCESTAIYAFVAFFLI
jgi:F-type H+-transporting ATPase subunit c